MTDSLDINCKIGRTQKIGTTIEFVYKLEFADPS